MSVDIEAVVFDFGGVLTQQPLDSHRDKLRALCGLDPSVFTSEYRRQRPAYDRGAEILRSLFEEDVASWTRVNEAVLNWAFVLQEAGVRTGILSNMPRDMLERIETLFRWFDRFDVKIFSCDVGVSKPDPSIYRTCLDALGLEAGKVLFFDDVPANVKGAEQAGIRTVLFRDYEDALRQVAEKGWLPQKLNVNQETL